MNGLVEGVGPGASAARTCISGLVGHLMCAMAVVPAATTLRQ